MLRVAVPLLLLVNSAFAVDWNAIPDSPTHRLSAARTGNIELSVATDWCRAPDYDCAKGDCRRYCKCSVMKKPSEPATPTSARVALFASYTDLDQAAKSRGGYRTGQRVVISIGQSDETNRAWQQYCTLRDWTFCVHDHAQPGLDAGVSQHSADSQGQLHPLVETLSGIELTDLADRYPIAPSQFVTPYFAAEPPVVASGAYADGNCISGTCR